MDRHAWQHHRHALARRLPSRWKHVLRRAFKVGVAAALATAIAQLFDLQNPWFATLAAIVAMEVTIRASLHSARNSLIGAVVGAGAGLAMAVLAKEEAWAVAVVVLVAFIVFGLLRMEAAGRQAALVASVIVLVPERTDLTTADFARIRLTETLIGIGVALAVNALIMPPRAYRNVRRDLAVAYQQLAVLYGIVTGELVGHPRDPEAARDARRQIRTRLRAVDGMWDEAMAEHPPPEVLAPHWRATTRRIWEQCVVMDTAAPEVTGSRLLAGAQAQIAALSGATGTALVDVGLAFAGERPVPGFPDLDPARSALLATVEEIEDHGDPPPFAESLQVLSVVNAMSVVANRLDDAVEAADPTSGRVTDQVLGATAVPPVVADHLACVAAADPDGMAEGYAPDAVLVRPDREYRGTEEIGAYFAGVPGRLGDGHVVVENATATADGATVRWRISGGPGDGTSGTDTYRVRDGAITHQTVAVDGTDF